MIRDVISADTTMNQSIDEREVYPEIRDYIAQAAPRLFVLMRADMKKPMKGSYYSRPWMGPHPRPQMRDQHQMQLMLEAELKRALIKEGFDLLDILPGVEPLAVTVYWKG